MNEPKRANQFKVRNPNYKPWTLKDVIENFSGRSFEEVKREQLEKSKKQ